MRLVLEEAERGSHTFFLDFSRMKKLLALLTGLLVIIGVTSIFGLYTYFLRTEVDERVPATTISVPAVPAEPTVKKRGSFVAVDRIHKGSGEARIITVDGTYFLRLENFTVTNGPDLHVYLSTSENPTGDLASLGDYRDLGLLKGNVGNQNYALPADLGDYRTAVIWCKRDGGCVFEIATQMTIF